MAMVMAMVMGRSRSRKGTLNQSQSERHRGGGGLFPIGLSSPKSLIHKIIISLVVIALLPPIFLHFKLRRLHQIQLNKCSWLHNPPNTVCAHGGDSSNAFPNTVIPNSLTHSLLLSPNTPLPLPSPLYKHTYTLFFFFLCFSHSFLPCIYIMFTFTFVHMPDFDLNVRTCVLNSEFLALINIY